MDIILRPSISGKFVLKSGGSGQLFDANPAPGSGNPCLAEVELPRSEMNSLLQQGQTTVESGGSSKTKIVVIASS